MKTKDFNKIVEETVFQEVKKRILKEQKYNDDLDFEDEDSDDIDDDFNDDDDDLNDPEYEKDMADRDKNDKIMRGNSQIFKAIINSFYSDNTVGNIQTHSLLMNHMKIKKERENDKIAFFININNLGEDDIKNILKTETIQDFQSKLTQNLNKNLGELDLNFDLDVNIENNVKLKKLFDIKLKISVSYDNDTFGIEESKKILRLNENQLIEIINKILSESVPGIEAWQNATKGTGRESKEHFSKVDEKLKKYLSFDGNDKPEFPHQIGEKEKKVARQATDDEKDFIDNNRGRGPQDLNYDNDNVDNDDEPSKEFIEKIKKHLYGDTSMGNSQDGLNAIKSNVGEKMFKNIEKRHDEKRKEPRYPKEPVPVKKKDDNTVITNVNENKKDPLVENNIKRMKTIYNYSTKTQ